MRAIETELPSRYMNYGMDSVVSENKEISI